MAEPGIANGRWRFRILGRFEAIRDGQTLRDADLGSRKQRRVLKLLIVERGHLVSSDQIVDALWTSAPPRPGRQVATLVSRLRAALGRELIQGGPDAYRFTPGPAASVDVDEARELVAEAGRRLAAGEFSLARTAADRAVRHLERGAVMEDEPYAEWADAARAEAAALLRTGRAVSWQAALAVHEPDAAMAAAERAIAADRFDEEAHRALMLAHRAAGRRADALAAYERLREALWVELGVEPAAETRDLRTEVAGTGGTEAVGTAGSAAAGAALPRGAGTATAVPGGRHGARTRPGHERSRSVGPDDAPAEPLDPAFVGRERELEQAMAAWRAAAGGDTRLVLLHGEAGIGKTTIAARVVSMARATGGIVLESRCYEAERSLFLQPIADAIRPLVLRSSPSALLALAPDGGAGLARVMPELPAAVGMPIPEPTIPELERRRAFEAAADLIRTLAGRQPVLLYLDDLQLAGAATLEFLHFLIRRAAPSRLLVLATVRAEEGDEVRHALGAVAETIELGPLPPDGVRRLAATMGAHELAERVVELTRGHPLFVVEMLRALAERAPGGEPDAPIPDTLRAAVLERVDRAGRDVADLLAAAAILGPRFDLGLAASLLDTTGEEAVRRAARAHRARLLIPIGRDYGFSNDLIHSIVYAASPEPVRILRHRRAAGLLAGHPELLARHAAAAGDWAQAAEAWLDAGAAAAKHYANLDADELLSRALDAAQRAGARSVQGHVRLARGRVLETLGKYQAAVEDAAAAVEIARDIQDRRLEMEGLRDMGGDPIVALGRTPADCIPHLEAARVIAEELGERGFAIDILRRLSVIETNNLQGEAARRYADVALTRAHDADSELARAAALDAAKTVAAYVGDVARLEALVAELRPLLERRDLPWFLQWTVFESSFVPIARAEWDAARARIGEALELNRRTGYHAYQAMFLAQQAWIDGATGRFEEALVAADRASQIASEVGHPWWIAFAASVRGRILVSLGAADAATTVLGAGLAVADRDRTQMYVLRCLGPLAEALALAGDRENATDIAERASAMVPPVAARPLFLHAADGPLGAARAWTVLGRPERAAPILAEVAAAAEASGWVEPLAAACLALAQARAATGDASSAAGLLRRSVDAAASGGLPLIEADAAAALARLVAVGGIDGEGAGGTDRTDGAAEEAADRERRARAGYAALLAALRDVELRDAFTRRISMAFGTAPEPLPVK